MDRDPHGAAVRRAEALEREVRDLRERAESSADTRAQLEALQQEIADARSRLEGDSERLASMEARLEALRGREPTKSPTPPPAREATPADRPRWITPVVIGIAVLAAAAALFLVIGTASEPGDIATSTAHPTYLEEELPSELADPRPRAVRAAEIFEAGLRSLAAGDERSARDAFMRAHGIYPPLPGPHRELGLLHLKARETLEMCAELATYLSLAPDAEDAVRIRELAETAPGPQRCRLD